MTHKEFARILTKQKAYEGDLVRAFDEVYGNIPEDKKRELYLEFEKMYDYACSTFPAKPTIEQLIAWADNMFVSKENLNIVSEDGKVTNVGKITRESEEPPKGKFGGIDLGVTSSDEKVKLGDEPDKIPGEEFGGIIIPLEEKKEEPLLYGDERPNVETKIEEPNIGTPNIDEISNKDGFGGIDLGAPRLEGELDFPNEDKPLASTPDMLDDNNSIVDLNRLRARYEELQIKINELEQKKKNIHSFDSTDAMELILAKRELDEIIKRLNGGAPNPGSK